MPQARSTPSPAIWTPAALAGLIALLATTPRVQESATLGRSFWAAALTLLAWNAVLWLVVRRRGGSPGIDVSLRPQHYVQALAQLAVFAYWGWYWRPVYDMAALIAAQLAFAYGVSMLLGWTRAGRWTLGFGPFPIIFSINLFLWFRDDWFYLQFLMIGAGFLGKELVRWNRGGRSAHVFNPSAFALGLFSLVLIATGTTDLTWGPEIASTLSLAPRIYLFLFLVGLVVMHFFSITLIAGTAAAVLFGLSAAYYAGTGVPYFIDSEIPAAVFLGLHLLVTDPSTSPRTPTGRVLFGGLYGLGVFTLYAVLGAAGAPTFYDKLLCVPLLNLSVRAIDAGVARLRAREGVGKVLSWLGESVAGATPPLGARLNLAHMAVWGLFFATMAATGRTDGRHTGDSLPFWEVACAEGRRNACDRLLGIEASYCSDASAWACNELGIHYTEGTVVAADAALGRGYFARACELRFQPACLNLLDEGSVLRGAPRPLDLRLLLREGGLNLMDLPEPELYRRACTHDWSFACSRVAAST
jgi:hypothetical protein